MAIRYSGDITVHLHTCSDGMGVGGCAANERGDSVNFYLAPPYQPNNPSDFDVLAVTALEYLSACSFGLGMPDRDVDGRLLIWRVK